MLRLLPRARRAAAVVFAARGQSTSPRSRSPRCARSATTTSRPTSRSRSTTASATSWSTSSRTPRSASSSCSRAHRRLGARRRAHAVRRSATRCSRSTASARPRWGCSSARQQGIGSCELEPLDARDATSARRPASSTGSTTRSRSVMPRGDDIASGAVPYAPSRRASAARGGAAVHGASVLRPRRREEAARVVELVRAARAEDSQRRRSRSSCATAATWRRSCRARDAELALPRHRDRAAGRAAGGAGPARAHARARTPPTASPGSRCCARRGAGSRSRTSMRSQAATSSATVLGAARDEDRVAAVERGRARAARARAPVLVGGARPSAAARRCATRRRRLARAGRAGLRGERTDLEDADVYLDVLGDAEEAGALADLAALDEGLGELFALPDARRAGNPADHDHPQGEGPRVRHGDRARASGCDLAPAGAATAALDRTAAAKARTAELLLAPVKGRGDDEIRSTLSLTSTREEERTNSRAALCRGHPRETQAASPR